MKLRIKSREETRKEDKRLKGPVAQYAGSTAVGALGTHGDILSLLGFGSKAMTPGQEALTNAEFDADPYERLWTGENDIAPRYGNLPNRQNIRSNLESIIAPSETQSERFAQRAGEKLGGGLALPMSALAQLIGQGTSIASQGAQEAGIVSPEMSHLLELGLDIGSGAISGRVNPNSKQKEAVDLARKAGLKEREIVPLVQSEELQRNLAKIGGRSGKSFKVLEEGKQKLGDFYNDIKDRGSRLIIDQPEKEQLVSSFSKIADGFKDTLHPSNDKKSVIDFIEGAIEALKDPSKPVSAGSLVSFWQDINNAVPWTSAGSFKKQLSALKEPLSNVFKKLDPTLASDFSITNELYSKGIQASKLVKPTEWTSFMNYVHTAAPVAALKYIQPEYAAATAGYYGLKSLARAAQTSPYTQGLGRKLIKSVNDGKFETASKVFNDLNKTLVNQDEKKMAEETLKPKLVIRKSKGPSR